MQEDIQILRDEILLTKLNETPYPPKVLYIKGNLVEERQCGGPAGPATLPHRYITIVGSRSCSQYAKQVTEEICKSLQGQPVTIISGLANGIDAHAHTCTLKYNLHTIAVLGCGLGEKVLRTHSNYNLACKILESGGALISEYKSEQVSHKWMFPARNRIMVGLSDLIIVIEAKEKSGTRITARLATDYNRDLLVVPNSIYSHYSKGSNELIKQGAYVYTEPQDIFNLLKLDFEQKEIRNYNPTENEKLILNTINQGHNTTQNILDICSHSLTTSKIIQILLNLEIEDIIKRIDGRYIIL
jgi:DNA processing protein